MESFHYAGRGWVSAPKPLMGCVAAIFDALGIISFFALNYLGPSSWRRQINPTCVAAFFCIALITSVLAVMRRHSRSTLSKLLLAFSAFVCLIVLPALFSDH
jgi:hypothetical protein